MVLAEDGGEKSSGLPWEGTDRDYKYEELLGRVFGILRENNPELTGEKKRTVMKPPQVPDRPSSAPPVVLLNPSPSAWGAVGSVAAC